MQRTAFGTAQQKEEPEPAERGLHCVQNDTKKRYSGHTEASRIPDTNVFDNRGQSRTCSGYAEARKPAPKGNVFDNRGQSQLA